MITKDFLRFAILLYSTVTFENIYKDPNITKQYTRSIFSLSQNVKKLFVIKEKNKYCKQKV